GGAGRRGWRVGGTGAMAPGGGWRLGEKGESVRAWEGRATPMVSVGWAPPARLRRRTRSAGRRLAWSSRELTSAEEAADWSGRPSSADIEAEQSMMRTTRGAREPPWTSAGLAI